MRDYLPKSECRIMECVVVNLDSMRGRGPHWVAYQKYNDSISYFHSFGNFPPPIELDTYFHRGEKSTRKVSCNYEIALLSDRLPKHLRLDNHILKYQLCYEHYNH